MILVAIREPQHRVEIMFSGSVTYRDRIRMIDQVSPQMIDRGLTCVLLDFSEAWASPVGNVTAKELEDRIRSEPALSGVYLAFVNSPDTHSVPTEAAARSNGMVVRRFYSREEAIAWLGGCESH